MRRKRYLVRYRTPNGEVQSHHLLAYGRLNALDWIAERGELIDCAPVKPKAAKAQDWKLDRAKVDEIIRFFDLKLPVLIKLTRGVATGGTHSLRSGWTLERASRAQVYNGAILSGDVYHHVTLSRAWSAPEAAKALWHELAHAHQDEETIGDLCVAEAFIALRAEGRNQDRYPYTKRPCEVVARSYEGFATEINPCA